MPRPSAFHLAHLYTVPFENLDISLGRNIACDEERFFHKIVDLRRGGFCYELNGAFAALLRELGISGHSAVGAGVARRRQRLRQSSITSPCGWIWKNLVSRCRLR